MPECREISHHFIAHTFSQSNNLYKQAYPTKPLTPLYALIQYEQLDITLYKKVTYYAMKSKILYLHLSSFRNTSRVVSSLMFLDKLIILKELLLCFKQTSYHRSLP